MQLNGILIAWDCEDMKGKINGHRISALLHEEVCSRHTIMWINLISQICTLKNNYDDNFCAMCILSPPSTPDTHPFHSSHVHSFSHVTFTLPSLSLVHSGKIFVFGVFLSAVGYHCIDYACLSQVPTLLPLPAQCWDETCGPPYPASLRDLSGGERYSYSQITAHTVHHSSSSSLLRSPMSFPGRLWVSGSPT